jgi:hypothetical protein
MPKGEAVEQFAASMHLALDLADIYPRDSLAAHILDVLGQFASFLTKAVDECLESQCVKQHRFWTSPTNK